MECSLCHKTIDRKDAYTYLPFRDFFCKVCVFIMMQGRPPEML